MNILFIHGRSQEGKDPQELKEFWISSLKEGLNKAGLKLPDNINFVLPFYGDKLKELIEILDKSIGNVLSRGQESDQETYFLYNFLTEVSSNANISINEILKNSDPEVAERGLVNTKFVHSLSELIDKKRGWGEWVIKMFTKDVFSYLTKTGIRNQINAIVENDLSRLMSQKTIVIAHSLGTIVGYNILTQPDYSRGLVKFFTLGSPLGLNSVKSHLKTPLKMPPSITNEWYNAFDKRDIVALNPLDKVYFPIDPAVVNNGNVDNFTDNRHGIEGYLSDSEVASTIYKAIK